MLRRRLQNLLRALGVIAFFLFLIYLNRPSEKSAKSSERAHSSQQKSDTSHDTVAAHKDSAQKPSIQSVPADRDKEELVFSLGHPQSFDDAKRILRRLFPRGTDVYCGCSYDFRDKKSVSLSSCGLSKGPERRERIEWEHVVPASLFGKDFPAWTQGDPLCQKSRKVLRGRNCAREASPDFRRMEADLYNLLPAVGELNQARSDLAYGDVPGEPRRFGPCDFEIKDKKVEPPSSVRGDLARIYVYMQARYPRFRIIHAGNKALLERWSDEDPMDSEERTRLARIEAIQGNSFYIGSLAALRDATDSALQTVQSKL